jgi:hypothetical protein
MYGKNGETIFCHTFFVYIPDGLFSVFSMLYSNEKRRWLAALQTLLDPQQFG